MLAVSMFLSPSYALPGLGAAAVIIFADMLQPGLFRAVLLVGMFLSMAMATVAFLYFQYPWGIPGCVMLIAADAWAFMRLREEYR